MELGHPLIKVKSCLRPNSYPVVSCEKEGKKRKVRRRLELQAALNNRD
jgi:hypothetical protein